MFNYLPMQWLFLFFGYSFFGWCFESTYVSIMEKHPVNRGFIRGPFLPLYGAGGIMMLVVSKPFYDNVFLVFIAGCVGATVLEYVTGVLMETLFKVRYWDYSHKKFNFQGHVSLESTIAWGICTVVFTHYLQIPIEMLILSIPYNVMTVYVVVVTIVFSADFAIAFRTAMDIRDVLMYMEKAKYEMAKMQKRLDVLIAFKGEDVKEGIGARMDGINNRIDALSNSLESSFGIIKQKMAVDPGAYVSRVRDEVTELYARYRVVMSRFTPGPVKSIYVWYRNRTIAGNPTMSSTKYKSSLEELKEKTKEG